MGQQEIYNFLKENCEQYFTVEDLAYALDAAANNVRKQIVKLDMLSCIELLTAEGSTKGKKKYLIKMNITDLIKG